MLRIDHRSPVYPVDPEITLGEFERRIMGESYEIVGVFDERNRLVLAPKQGGSDRVGFVDAEAPHLRGAIVTHNHPFGGVFSFEDATLATDQGVGQLRAVCPDGTVYVLTPAQERWPEAHSMQIVVERSLRALVADNERRRSMGASILKGRARDALLFVAQQRGFDEIGVRMDRSDVWRR